jgi:hypothetical protein
MPLPAALRSVMAPAFEPCACFQNVCSGMRWAPELGHVPRGFYGAFGSPSEVELVLVFAEPGDPHDGESHDGCDSAYDYTGTVFLNGKDQFHRNVRLILESCWPGTSFEEQMRKTWLTDSVLCSAVKEGVPVASRVTDACGTRYLKRRCPAHS